MSNDMISYNDIENVRENPDNVPQTYKDEDQWPLVLWQTHALSQFDSMNPQKYVIYDDK